MLKIGLLSRWHVHANEYAEKAIDSGLVTIAGVWDEDPVRGEAWAKELGCNFYHKLEDLFPHVSAVICNAPTSMHTELLLKAAQAGKHIFTEKVLAATTKECEELTAAIEKANITFTISFPQKVMPVMKLAKDLIEKGAFGKISNIRIRNGHSGLMDGWLPSYWMNTDVACGGALMDLGCHPVYLASWFLGNPVSIQSMMSSPFGSDTDECATATIRYENGAIATVETSLISFGADYLVEIYGSDGIFVAFGDQINFKSRKLPDFVPTLPEKGTEPIYAFVEACCKQTGTPAEFACKEAILLTKLIQHAYTSNQTGEEIKL